MPKKACCCIPSGHYIAVPCRSYQITSVSDPVEVGLTKRPTRIVYNAGGSQELFDSTRTIAYMMRGGGGAGNSVGQGGNGAYGEYRQVASLSVKFRPGAGGTAGQTTLINTTQLPHAGGGQGYVAAGFGGGGSVLSNTSTTTGGKKVAGGGGAGRENNGGHGGTYNGITGSGIYGGGAASQTTVGSAGTNTFNTTAGSVTKGGHGAYTTSPLVGHGGGGGGGNFGGGGGGATFGSSLSQVINGGGGGGGSSTIDSTSTNFIEGSDNGSGALCNPHMTYSGLGGRRTTKAGVTNSSFRGQNGSVVYYFIDRYCLCDGENNENFPSKLFLCLSKDQYDSILNQAGEYPGDAFDPYQLHFTLNGVKYILIGNPNSGFDNCNEICESNFTESGTPGNVYWGAVVEGQGPACCEIIRCFRYCSTTETCDTCSTSFDCDNLSYYCCENVQDKPNEYWSLRGNYVYKCIKTNAWVNFGETSQTSGPVAGGGGWGSGGGAGGGGFGGYGGASNLPPNSIDVWGIPGCLPVVSEESLENLCAITNPKNCNTTIPSVSIPPGFQLPDIKLEWNGSCCQIECTDSILCNITSVPICQWVSKPFSGSCTIVGGNGSCFASDGSRIDLQSFVTYQSVDPVVAFSVSFTCDSQNNNASFTSTSASVCGATVTVVDEDPNDGNIEGNFCDVFAAALQSLLNSGGVSVSGSSDVHSSEVNPVPVITTNPSGTVNTITWYANESRPFLYSSAQLYAPCDTFGSFGLILAEYTGTPILYSKILNGTSGGSISFTILGGIGGCNPPELFKLNYLIGDYECLIDLGNGQVEIITITTTCIPDVFPFDALQNCRVSCTTDSCGWSITGDIG
jgi:hypothetical protein